MALNVFRGKIYTITGAASGIGRATAILLASKGAKVSLCDVQEKLLAATVDEINEAAETQVATGAVVDVRNRSQVESWISKTVVSYGKLDGAANIAGVTGKDLGNALVEDIDDEDFQFVMDVNVKGALNCMRAQIKNMNEAGGSIVNVSSLAGLLGLPKHGSYNASKHALNGLSKAAAKELGPRNIRVNVIAPGTIDTPMLRASSLISGNEYTMDVVPLGRPGTPKEVAEAIAWYLSSQSSFVTSSILNVDGGWLH